MWITRNRAIITLQSIIFAVMASAISGTGEEEELLRREQECILMLSRCTCLTEMEENVLGFLEETAELLNRDRGGYAQRQAAMALDYIEKHYDDPELSLSTLCPKLAISTSYFSTVFKEYAGKTFIEALTEKRMERAKEILQMKNLKMYEVAEKCGYRDANYFSATFKKMYGMTPREYVKACRKDRDG